MAEVDLRALLKKYIGLVAGMEGVSFIPREPAGNGPFSDEEAALLRQLECEVEEDIKKAMTPIETLK